MALPDDDRWFGARAGIAALSIVAACAPVTGARTPVTQIQVLTIDEPSQPKGDDLTPDDIRSLVVNADRKIGAHLTELYMSSDRNDVIGQCANGEDATRFIRAAELHAVLGQYFTGPALSCHQEAYYGPTLGDWVAKCLSSPDHPEFSPDDRSVVVILERDRERVVADVSEPKTIIPEGEPESAYQDLGTQSRYTLVRSPGGEWLIYDRLPNHSWACPWQNRHAPKMSAGDAR